MSQSKRSPSVADELRYLAGQSRDAEADTDIRPMILHMQVPPERADDGSVEHGSGQPHPNLKICGLRHIRICGGSVPLTLVPVEEHHVNAEPRLQHSDAGVPAMIVVEAVIDPRRRPEVHRIEQHGTAPATVGPILAQSLDEQRHIRETNVQTEAPHFKDGVDNVFVVHDDPWSVPSIGGPGLLVCRVLTWASVRRIDRRLWRYPNADPDQVGRLHQLAPQRYDESWILSG